MTPRTLSSSSIWKRTTSYERLCADLPTPLDNGRRSPRKLFRAVVARCVEDPQPGRVGRPPGPERGSVPSVVSYSLAPVGGRAKPALPTFAYGVGSANVPPKMSLLPNVPGQTEFGAGFAIGVGVLSDWLYASTAGQSAALRTST